MWCSSCGVRSTGTWSPSPTEDRGFASPAVPTVRHEPARPAASRHTDILALLVVVLAATAVRFADLGSPDRLVFDEVYYAQDACSYLGFGAETCGVATEASRVHPPLGKWLIALGIAAFGHNPVGWRVVPAVAGVVTVALIYVLTRRVTASTLGATVAGIVLALDPLSVVSSRVGMLDVFTASAGAATILFVVCHCAPGAAGVDCSGRRSTWLAAAGIAGGIAIATKWSGAYALAAAIVLTGAFAICGARRAGLPARAGLRSAVPGTVLWLVAVPLLVYTASYIGRLDADILAVPWRDGAWLRELIDRQLFMLSFHAGLDDTHPYASPAWSWPLAKRAVVYFFEVDEGGRYREILAVANPLLWLPAFGAAMRAALVAIRGRCLDAAALAVAITVAATYLPWLILTADRPFVFLHYIVPTIPFLAVALGWAVTVLRRRQRKALAGYALGVSAAVFIFFAPLIYAQPLEYDSWRQRMLFADCTPAEVTDGRLAPRPLGGPPPPGWCWV